MPGAIDAKAINIHMQVTGPFAAQMARNGQAVQTFGSQANAGMAKAQSGAASFGATAGKVATGGAVAIAVGLALSAKAAITFESSFAGVRKTVDTTEEGFQRLSDGIRKLSTEIPIGVNELARITELGGQLGVDAPNLLEFTEVIAKIGVTTTLSTEEAATGFARLDNIMQLGKDSFEEMGSTIVDLGNNFAATEDEILQFALRVAPIGATVGLATDEVLAIATAFTSVGVRAERGGTAIQKTFIEIAEAAQGGGEELTTFARVAGLTEEQFASLAESDPAAAFQSFITGLNRIDDEGQNVFATLDTLHLGNSRVVQSLLAMANAENVLVDALETGDEAWRENIALNEEAQKRFETTASQLEILKNRVIDIGIAIGSVLLPAINLFVDGLGVIIDWLVSLNRTAVITTAAIGGVALAMTAAGAHPVIAAVGLAATAVAAIGYEARESEKRIQAMKNLLADTGATDDIDLTGIGVAQKNINILKDLGLSGEQIREAVVGTQEDYQRIYDLAKDTGAELFAGGDELDFILSDASTGFFQAFADIDKARRDATSVRSEGPTAEDLEVQRLERQAAARQHLIDVNREFQVETGKLEPVLPFPALLDTDQQSDIEDAADDYVAVFRDAFAEIRTELSDAISLFYEFGDEFEFVWADLAASAIRQTQALVSFNEFFLTHDLPQGVEAILRANFTTFEQMESFIKEFEADPTAAWMSFRKLREGVVEELDKLALVLLQQEMPELEFAAGEDILSVMQSVASEIAENDLYNPVQAWLAVIEATSKELSPEAFSKIAESLKRLLASPSFLETTGIAKSELQGILDLLAEISGTVAVDVDVKWRFPGEVLTNGKYIPDPVRTPEPGDARFSAFGGNVMGGEPTWVGELGKELFVPFSSGTIIPNSKLGEGGSTNTTTVIVQNSEHRDLRSDISAGLFAGGVRRQVETLVK